RWSAFVLYGDPSVILVQPRGLFLSDGRLNGARFSPQALTALHQLPSEAHATRYPRIGIPHMFIALAGAQGGTTQAALHQVCCDPAQVCAALRAAIMRDE